MSSNRNRTSTLQRVQTYFSLSLLTRLDKYGVMVENDGTTFSRNNFIAMAVKEKLDRDEGRILSEDHIEPRRREGVRLVEGEARSFQPYV